MRPSRQLHDGDDGAGHSRRVDAGSEERREERILSALKTLREALQGVKGYYTALKHSTDAEPAALLNALNGGYVEPCSAGDPIVNPQAVPTGRNFYSINPETTPSAEAWKTGKRLAEDLLAAEMTANGKYPEKVSFTLWSTDFISSEGATIAQILYLLGVEPMRDASAISARCGSFPPNSSAGPASTWWYRPPDSCATSPRRASNSSTTPSPWQPKRATKRTETTCAKDSRMPNACCSKRDSLRQTHANMRANGYSAV